MKNLKLWVKGSRRYALFLHLYFEWLSAFVSIFISSASFQLKWLASSRVSGELAVYQIFISFGFQREIEAGLEPPSQFSNVLKAKLHGKYKETLTPPGVAIRNAWGPILFKYCRVQYNREQKRLEIMKGEFAGKCKLTRHMSQVKDLKCYYDLFNEDDDDEGGDDDADNDDGQVPLDVVAGDILPGLCFLFWKNGNTLDGWKGHWVVHLVGYFRNGL